MSHELGRFQHPRFARMYERISAEAEQRGTEAQREQLPAGLFGRVIELGAGNGLNFAHYPATVTEVLALEPEDRLRALAEQAAHHPRHTSSAGPPRPHPQPPRAEPRGGRPATRGSG